jgi:hypothetical protein
MKSTRPQPSPQLSPLPPWQLFLQQNATRILLGVSLGILALLILRYRSESARQREADARIASARAQSDIRQLRQILEVDTAQPPELIAARREQLTAQIMNDLSIALADSADTDADIRSAAYTTRGDLYWALANAPSFPQAATRPALNVKDPPDQLLTQAQTDYQHVVDQYPTQIMPWSTAQLGLAAIAENRGNWDDARKHLESIENRTTLPDLIKSVASSQLAYLSRIQSPILLGPYPTTAPTTQLATPHPATTHPG